MNASVPAPLQPPSPPALAFLFTDIEGSTKLYERLGAAYRAVLFRHNELLRAQFTRHGGNEVKDTGDGFLVAFADPAQAVACTVAAQGALARCTWPGFDGELRVRMAVHWGAATFEAGDYRGIVLHHASRAVSAAHGGQILCTDALFHALPVAARESLRSVGLYRLRDVTEPVRLFEVIFPGMRSEPPRAAPAFTHNLPVTSTRFFGREEEIRQLTSRLLPEVASGRERGTGRLLTMLGPGGTGKTRLARAVAEGLLTVYDHAVWFIPLADLREPTLLAETIRDALRLVPEPAVPILDQLVEFLGMQPSLLILDNFEQITEGGAPFVNDLLKRLPSLVCLITSRQRLDLSGECEFVLGPLATPSARVPFDAICRSDSVRLFTDRARAARQDFELTPERAQDVAELCRALEGMPLALELAAARANVLMPRQMLSRIAQRLDFLVGGQRDLAQRHRTLRATIDWSYDLLAPPLARVFARLSIFRGGWSLSAAEAVMSESETERGKMLEYLSELRSNSLITATAAGEEMRYRMFEAILEYAAERARVDGGLAALEERHHAYFFRLCRGDDLPDAAEWHHRVLADLDNIRAMLGGSGPLVERLRAAVCLYPFWTNRGTLREGRDWLERLSAQAPPELDATGAAAANAAAILAWKAGDHTEAQTRFQAALTYWEAQGNEANVAGLLNNLGILAVERGELLDAQDFYERSIGIYRRHAVPEKLAAVLSNFAENALRLGHLASAGEALGESERLLRRSGDLSLLANTLHNFAEWHLRRGSVLEARRTLAESLQLRAKLESQDYLVATWTCLAAIALAEHRLDHAVICLSAASKATEREEEDPSLETRTNLAEHLATVRTEMDSKAFEVGWARGETAQFSDVLEQDGEWRLSRE